jgi:small subunit ribosomal protein S8
MNKNLIDFLIKLKNASLARKHHISLDFANAFKDYLPILYKKGYIQSFNVEADAMNKRKVSIFLRYYQNRILTENIKILSVPSKTKILSYNDLTKINLKNKLMILSTSKGILSHKECLKFKTGGIAMFVC